VVSEAGEEAMSLSSAPSRSVSPVALVREFLSLIRFSHTLFALPFALAALLLAWRASDRLRWPEWAWDLGGIVVCMVLARSTAMAFNRLADHRFDAANPRTASRHLPTGRLSRRAVWLFTLLCAAGFVVSTFHFVIHNGNWWPVYLSVPVLVFVCGYSLAKRFTVLSHFWLGASLMLAPVATWLAITGGVAPVPVLLGLAVWSWVAGFDIIYACQDADFDRRAGLYSLPAWLGVARALRLAMLCHLLMLGLLVALGFTAGLGWIYFAGIALVAGLLAWEHWLVRPDDLSRVNTAFFHVNAVISVGLLLLIAADLWLGGTS
jgi:4-hydroxybenzoate polyprenyltransferase